LFSQASQACKGTRAPAVEAVQFKSGDRVVCIGTAFGRFEKGQLGTIERLEGSHALVLLAGKDAPISIDASMFEHADGIEWELRDPRAAGDPRPRVDVIREHIKTIGCLQPTVARSQEIEDGLQELFKKQDLNGDNVLEELELIKLNQKIAMLHYGKDSKDAKKATIEEKYIKLFREKLDARGDAIVYPLFREYILERLDAVDPDPRAQVMIVEQWIAEAQSGREAFRYASMRSESDGPYVPESQQKSEIQQSG